MVGHPAKARFSVNVPLRKSVLQGGERMVAAAADGKPALTFFQEVERYAEGRLMQATLGTGRTHQIRVHAQHIGHPIAGDDKYGDEAANRRLREQVGLKRLFLHASTLEFALDGGKAPYLLNAPLASDLIEVLDRLA